MIKIDSAFPLYVVEDLDIQKSFYANAFGFDAVFFDPQFYLHLVNSTNGIELGFMLANLSCQPEFLRPTAKANGMVVTFEVIDAQAAYQQAIDDQLDIIYELTVETWNQTHFMVQDPAGLVIDLVQDSNQPDL